jgi:hypothetical protein
VVSSSRFWCAGRANHFGLVCYPPPGNAHDAGRAPRRRPRPTTASFLRASDPVRVDCWSQARAAGRRLESACPAAGRAVPAEPAPSQPWFGEHPGARAFPICRDPARYGPAVMFGLHWRTTRRVAGGCSAGRAGRSLTPKPKTEARQYPFPRRPISPLAPTQPLCQQGTAEARQQGLRV